MVKSIYYKEVHGNIISPIYIVHQHKDKYQDFTIEADCDNGKGVLKFLHRDGTSHITCPITMDNDLWFNNYTPGTVKTPAINTLNCACFSDLWHGRLAHTGETTTRQILGYTSTTKNVYFIDDETSTVKMEIHAIFYEAHFTVPKAQTPIVAQSLQCVGFSKPNDVYKVGNLWQITQ